MPPAKEDTVDPWFNDETQRWEDSEGRPRRPVLRSQTTSARSIDRVRADLAWTSEHGLPHPCDSLDRAVLRTHERDVASRRLAQIDAVWDASEADDIDLARAVDPDGVGAALAHRRAAKQAALERVLIDLRDTLNRWRA